jgi:hypothetical protein
MLKIMRADAMGGCLEGREILLVEDEYFIAMEVQALLQALGARVIGPYGRLGPALAALVV